MEEDILYDFRNIVEESRIEDNTDYYMKLRDTLDFIENLLTRYKNLKVRHNGTKEALRVSEDLEKHFSEEASILEAELEKKDKVINEMAEQLIGLSIYDANKEIIIFKNEEEVKEYFTKKVEGE